MKLWDIPQKGIFKLETVDVTLQVAFHCGAHLVAAKQPDKPTRDDRDFWILNGDMDVVEMKEGD